MNKEKLKKIKVLYDSYIVLKKIVSQILFCLEYPISLINISMNTKRVKKKIAKNKVLNVVFIIQYVPSWNKLKPIFNKMLDDDRFNPIIVCVPLNIQNHVLMDKNGNDTYQYFVEHGYKAIDALHEDGSWFDIKQLQPDFVFHSRPYNAFMPKCYTSGRIVKYALICNVMYGVCLSLNEQKACINKEYYKDVYIYYSFDSSEAINYKNMNKLGTLLHIQKCYPYGATGIEQILESKKENKNRSFKKTVLWTPRWSTDSFAGGSNFFNYRSTIIRFAEENNDVLFVFRPHPLMFKNFIKSGEMTKREVEEFKEYCQIKENVILDESNDYSETFWNSDLLITDLSGIVPEYFITGKPIIYCHSNVHFQYTEPIEKIIHSCYEAQNSDDVIRYFYQLISPDDYKLKNREDCMNELFSDVENNSNNIVKSLFL